MIAHDDRKYYVRLVPIDGYSEPCPETKLSPTPGSTLMNIDDVRSLERAFVKSGRLQ